MKKALYLREAANSVIMQSFLQTSLHEMLGISGKYVVVPFSYPGWPTAEFIKQLSFKISDSMYSVGEKLAKEKFKNFNPEKTKLTSDMLEEMWMEASKIITQEIYKGFGSYVYPNRIPGLKESIEEGALIPSDRDENTELNIQAARKTIKEKAEQVDYQDDLLRRFREKYFSHMQETYDLFLEEQKELPKRELGVKIH